MKGILTFLVAAGLLGAADLGRGVQLYQAKNYPEAEKELRAVIAADPNNAQGHCYLGMTLLQRGDTAGALQELQKSDQLQPGKDDTKVALADAYLKQKDLANGEAALNQAVQINPNNPGIPYVRGQVKLAKKDYAGAIQDLEQAVAADPGNAYAHYYLALAYSGAKTKPDKVAEHLDMFLKLAPNAPEAGRARSVMQAVRK